MTDRLDRSRILDCFERARAALLAERSANGHWVGELSPSPLSTATAILALELVRRGRRPVTLQPAVSLGLSGNGSSQFRATGLDRSPHSLDLLIARGLRWLAAQQQADGGWGDTPRSVSNIATTMLCQAVFHGTGQVETYSQSVTAAAGYIERAGGIRALQARYGKDRTFSAPILTHCALAGVVPWSEVPALPFELACVPPRFFKWLRLPVVSYALPALIAIGQARRHFLPPRNPVARLVRGAAAGPSLNVLERIQPAGGGFLEATPLTSFVVMSLAGMGLTDHPVVRKGVEFLVRSARDEGSWPIDTNLATWVSTLAVNALGSDLPAAAEDSLRLWLFGQQFQSVHPYTQAEPGGWAWTDLPGGVPDADDTPGAILALTRLCERDPSLGDHAVVRGCRWLLALQNRDGGWPTFCRGWGALPFDRSAPDITAHVLRALDAAYYAPHWTGSEQPSTRVRRAIERGFGYLSRSQRPDGAWLPLWFGNQQAPNDENPTYGTARVLAAYRDSGRLRETAATRGLDWLRGAQNPDGGWGGDRGIPSSIEETALAAEVLLSLETRADAVSEASRRGLEWLMNQVDQGTWVEPSPIGFYFAKLWYFEKLYPMIFTVAALRAAALLVR